MKQLLATPPEGDVSTLIRLVPAANPSANIGGNGNGTGDGGCNGNGAANGAQRTDRAPLHRIHPLGKVLVDRQAITPDHLTRAMENQRENGRTLGRILVEMGALAERERDTAGGSACSNCW